MIISTKSIDELVEERMKKTSFPKRMMETYETRPVSPREDRVSIKDTYLPKIEILRNGSGDKVNVFVYENSEIPDGIVKSKRKDDPGYEQIQVIIGPEGLLARMVKTEINHYKGKHRQANVALCMANICSNDFYGDFNRPIAEAFVREAFTLRPLHIYENDKPGEVSLIISDRYLWLKENDPVKNGLNKTFYATVIKETLKDIGYNSVWKEQKIENKKKR